MIQFQASINSQPVERGLQAFEQSLADHTPALAAIAGDIREMIEEQFATEGRAGGTPWAPLAPSTRRRRRSASSILDSTGALSDSLRTFGAPGHVEEMTGASLALGTNLGYALFHQTGAGIGFGQTSVPPQPAQRGKKSGGLGRRSLGTGRGRALPMRPLMVMTQARSERWVEFVHSAIQEKTLLLGEQELVSGRV